MHLDIGSVEAKDRHITFKELVAIPLACAVWGDRWAGS